NRRELDPDDFGLQGWWRYLRGERGPRSWGHRFGGGHDRVVLAAGMFLVEPESPREFAAHRVPRGLVTGFRPGGQAGSDIVVSPFARQQQRHGGVAFADDDR